MGCQKLNLLLRLLDGTHTTNYSGIYLSYYRYSKTLLHSLNSLVQIDTFNLPLDPTNAEKILKDYDVILDCTDNAPTRYLLSDTSAKLRKPLVSGAAQRLDGQLCTYGLPLKSKMDDKEGGAGSDRGPCYRCLFPKPPAPEMAGSCEETGILGAVTGVIGSLQALEAIKIIADLHGENIPIFLLVIIRFFDDTDVYELFVIPPRLEAISAYLLLA